MVGTGKAAEEGILIKSAESLELAHLVDAIVLDKTGTITVGKPQVNDVFVFNNIEKKELLKIVGTIEKKSEHPIAKAILEVTKEIELWEAEKFEIIQGKGIKASVNNNIYFVGNQSLMQENNIQILEAKHIYQKLYEQAKTVIFVANNKKLLGIIAISDTVKQTSIEAIKEFKEMKIETFMLTGDNKESAEAIGKMVGIDNIISEVLPQEKERKVRNLQEQGKTVAMIGDGINDSPALSRANVGIAIGAGTDIAIEAADVVLIKSNLTDVVYLLSLSKSVIKNIKINLFWAFFYNTIGIPLACGVLYKSFGILLNPMISALAMSLSSICVVTNALRLRKFKIKKEVKNMTKTIYVKGMQCEHCSNAIKKELLKLEEINNVEVELKTGKVELDLSKDIKDEILKEKIEELGYTMM